LRDDATMAVGMLRKVLFILVCLGILYLSVALGLDYLRWAVHKHGYGAIGEFIGLVGSWPADLADALGLI
jgi:hypothetical protein